MPKKIIDASKAYKHLENRVGDLNKKFEKFIETQTKTADALKETTKQVEEQSEASKDAGGWIRNLRNKFKKINEEGGESISMWSKYGRQMSIVRSRLLIISFAFGLVARSLGRMFEAAAKQQQAEIKLATALGRTSSNLKEYAASMQQVTNFGDEVIIDAQAQIAAFVKNEDQIKALTAATLDLAAAKGMDLSAAADLVAKSFGSSTNALARYGIAAFGAVGSTERLESIVKNITILYGGQAKEQADSFSGSLIGMKDALGDAAEATGVVFSPVILAATFSMKLFAEGVDFISKKVTNFTSVLLDWALGIEAPVELTAEQFQNMQEQVSSMSFAELKESVKVFGQETTFTALATKEMTKIQAQAQLMYFKTAESQKTAIQTQIDWANKNKAAFETEKEHIEVLKDLQNQLDQTGASWTVNALKGGVAMGKISKAGIAMAKGNKQQTIMALQLGKAQGIMNIIVGATQAIKMLGPLGILQGLATMAQGMAMIATIDQQIAKIKSTPKFAQGGDFITTGPQMMMVGDNPGGRERVSVTPLSSPNIEGPQGETSVVVNVSGNILTQDFVEGELAENIKEAIRRGTDFGIS